MLDNVASIAVIVVLIALVFLIYVGAGRKKRRACEFIIEDLKRRGANGPGSAVTLPYMKTQHYEVGMKNYRLKALEYLIIHNIVCCTEKDRFYLGEAMNRDV